MNSGTDLGKLFENTDAVFILCYAIILLNVDQHNPQNKKPMTVEVSGAVVDRRARCQNFHVRSNSLRISEP